MMKSAREIINGIVPASRRRTGLPPGGAARAAFDFVWGTDRRRSIFVTAALVAAAAVFQIKMGISAERLMAASAVMFGVLFLVSKPYWGVIILMFFDIAYPFMVVMPASELPAFLGKLSFAKFFGLLVLLAFVVNYAATGKRIKLGHPVQVFFLYLFTIVGVLSSFNAFKFKEAKLEVIRLFLLAIFYIVTYNLLDDAKKVFKLYGVCSAAIFYVCFYAVYEAYVLHVDRPHGGTGIPGGLSLVGNLGFALFLVLFLELKSRFRRFLCLAALFISSVGIFLSNTRGGFVTLVFTLFFQLVRKKTFYRYYIPIILILLLLLNILPEIYTYRTGEFITRVYERGIGAVKRDPRYAVYFTGIDLFIKNPILGVGPWHFKYYYAREYAEKLGQRRIGLVHHSGILGLLAEFGFFAFVFFTGYVITAGFIFRRSAKLAELYNRPREYIAVVITEAMFWAFFAWGIFQEIAGNRLAYIFPAVGAAIYYRLIQISKSEKAGQ